MLASFSKMTELQADNNDISDITALSSCTRLYRVSLEGLSNATVTEIFYLIISYDSKIDYSALGETVTMKCVIAGCPLDQQLNVKNALGSYLGSYATTFVDSGEPAYNFEDYLFNDIMGNPEYYQ